MWTYTIKTILRQITPHEDSIVEDYMVYQSLVYISEYLAKLETKINLHHNWDVDSLKIFEGEVMSGKVRMR